MLRKGWICFLLLLCSAVFVQAQDYEEALKKGVLFFDANRCGPGVGEGNSFSWRSACHADDVADRDLTGGFHSNGDMSKHTLNQAFSASMLGWSLYEYSKDFSFTGSRDSLLATLKYFSDYFFKCVDEDASIVISLGQTQDSPDYWGPPELDRAARQVVEWSGEENPASDVLGMTSAALSLMYLNYQKVDKGYADRCLELAQKLYVKGKSQSAVNNGGALDYRSASFYDDLAWAAIWLFEITQDFEYMRDVHDFLWQFEENGFVAMKEIPFPVSRDNVSLAVMTKLALISKGSVYRRVVEESLNGWKYQWKTSPGGLRFLGNQGLSATAAQVMIAMLYEKTFEVRKYLDLSASQIDYILGDNPEAMSYEIGYGDFGKKVEYPDHMAAQGYEGLENQHLPACHELTGALVSGPAMTDLFDNRFDSDGNKVSLEANALFVGALAGVYDYYTMPKPTYVPIPGYRITLSSLDLDVSSRSCEDYGYDFYRVYYNGEIKETLSYSQDDVYLFLSPGTEVVLYAEPLRLSDYSLSSGFTSNELIEFSASNLSSNPVSEALVSEGVPAFGFTVTGNQQFVLAYEKQPCGTLAPTPKITPPPRYYTLSISSHLNPASTSCNFYHYQDYFVFVNGEEAGIYNYSEQSFEISVPEAAYVSFVSAMMPLPTPPVSYGYIHEITGQYYEVDSPYDVVSSPVASEEILSIQVFLDVDLTVEYNISATCPSVPPTPPPTPRPEVKVRIMTNVVDARYTVAPDNERGEQGVYYFFKNEPFTVTCEDWTVGDYCGITYSFGGFDGDFTQKSKTFMADKDMVIELFWHALIPSCPAYYLYLNGPGNIIQPNSRFKTEILYTARQGSLGSYDFTVEFDNGYFVPDTSLGWNGVEAGRDGFITTVSLYRDKLHITGYDVDGTGPGVDQQILIFHWLAGDKPGVTMIGMKVTSFVDISTEDIPLTTGGGFKILIDDSVILGDVNSDNLVNIVDALLIAQYYVGLITDIDEKAADVNRDDRVNIVDALLVAQYYVGLIKDF